MPEEQQQQQSSQQAAITQEETLKVVVVGAQHGGAQFVQTFLKQLASDPKKFPEQVSLTVIDAKQYWFNAIAAPRAICDIENWSKRVFVPLDQIFGKYGNIAQLKFINGKVTEVDSLNVILADGQKVPYSVLILATGFSYNVPFKIDNPKLSDGESELASFAARLKEARSALVIGGGPVGCELAGELANHFPDKKITLVHSQEKLLSGVVGINEKLQDKILDMLKQAKVEVILNDRVEVDLNNFGDGKSAKTLKLKSGKEVESDLQYLCTGMKLNTEFLKSFDNGKCLNDKGQVKVDAKFQVQGYSNIFAIGDINDIKCEKQGYVAGNQGELLGKNLGKLISIRLKKGETLSKDIPTVSFKNVEDGSTAIFLSLGPKQGVGQMGKFVAGNFLVSLLKSKNLFYDKVWKNVNLKPPAK